MTYSPTIRWGYWKNTISCQYHFAISNPSFWKIPKIFIQSIITINNRCSGSANNIKLQFNNATLLDTWTLWKSYQFYYTNNVMVPIMCLYRSTDIIFILRTLKYFAHQQKAQCWIMSRRIISYYLWLNDQSLYWTHT